MDRILLSSVQSKSKWRYTSTKLSPDRHRGLPSRPSQRSGHCSTIFEERKVCWSWQHPSRTNPSRWRRKKNHCSHNKSNLQQCQNYQTISLISHPSKIMLKIILKRLKPQAEKLSTEEQAGFRAGRSTTEQIFSL